MGSLGMVARAREKPRHLSGHGSARMVLSGDAGQYNRNRRAHSRDRDRLLFAERRERRAGPPFLYRLSLPMEISPRR